MSTRIRRRPTESTWHWRARQKFGPDHYRLGKTYYERDGSSFVEVWNTETDCLAGHFACDATNFGHTETEQLTWVEPPYPA